MLSHMPERVLRSQLRRGAWHVLILWAGLPESEATWEPVDAMREAFPDFQPDDELFPEGGRDVMVGITYERRRLRCG